MAGEVLYTRVAADLKEAAEKHAEVRGLTLTAGVAELLGIGLEAVQNERSIRSLTDRVTNLENELAKERLQRERAEQRYRALQDAGTSLGERAERNVGKCSRCGEDLAGADLLVRGGCSNCGEPVSLIPAGSGLNERELLLLAGALGVAVGMLISRK
ncbi:hypothetical protein [Dactylosporangium sp. NPDC051541]|uniref:hypothetical protein n=1 Tax=Dactylosporangium sp. NPDC051541 TaxID=3363977 RepID=UPI0037BE018C